MKESFGNIRRTAKALLAGAMLTGIVSTVDAQMGKISPTQEQATSMKTKWASDRAAEVARDTAQVTNAEMALRFESIALRPFVENLKLLDIEGHDKLGYSQIDYKAVKKEFEKITKAFEGLEQKFHISRTGLWTNLDRMLRYNASDEGQEEMRKIKQMIEHPESIDGVPPGTYSKKH